MIRLGLRLTLQSGREPLLRVLVTAAAVALGVGLLLAALAGVNGLHAQTDRGAWLDTSAQASRPASASGRSWWLSSTDQFGNQAIDRPFLESARRSGETLYAAFALILVMGLRKGEVLGLTRELIDFDAAELYVGEQVQRVGRQILRRQVKTETSQAPLPLIDLCIAALKFRKKQQDTDRERAGNAWIETGLVFTTRHGTPIEPRNFGRSFDRCVIAARVPRITVHGTRKTCGSLLAALDVHPRVAMQILRHSKIAVTMEIYTEVPSAATRDALRKLSDLLA